jgi:hypothetical protein
MLVPFAIFWTQPVSEAGTVPETLPPSSWHTATDCVLLSFASYVGRKWT